MSSFSPSITASDGLFSPDSVIWRVNREHILVAGGMAASILQNAHPSVAHGVKNHSNFRRQPMLRLKNTLNAVYTVAFGTHTEVEKLRHTIALMHRAVQGSTVGGRKYSAFDPDAQMWVLATLIQTSICLYQRWVGPLTPKEKQAYLQEFLLFGEVFGLDPAHGPSTWNEFCDYYDAMIHGDLLGSDPVCAEVAQAIAFPETPFWLAQLAKPLHFLVTEFIPSPVRERLGFQSHPWTDSALRVTDGILPLLLPWLPQKLRFSAHYLEALKRNIR